MSTSEGTKSPTTEAHVHGPDCNHNHAHNAPLVRTAPKQGRNDDCSCGSGKKYKKCCLKSG